MNDCKTEVSERVLQDNVAEIEYMIRFRVRQFLDGKRKAIPEKFETDITYVLEYYANDVEDGSDEFDGWTETELVTKAKVLAAEFFMEASGVECLPGALTAGVIKTEGNPTFGWVSHRNGGGFYTMPHRLAKALFKRLPSGKIQRIWHALEKPTEDRVCTER